MKWPESVIAIHLLTLMSALLPACSGGSDTAAEQIIAGGEPDAGAGLIKEYACGSCHTIPGVRRADGLVGPPLSFFAKRIYIAGRLPNTPENLIYWIQDPQEVDSQTAMPDLGVDEVQARHIAAYLYSLN